MSNDADTSDLDPVEPSQESETEHVATGEGMPQSPSEIEDGTAE